VAGSIRVKDHRLNVWELRIYVGRDSTGRVRHRQTTFHGSRRQAEREQTHCIGTDGTTPPVSSRSPKTVPKLLWTTPHVPSPTATCGKPSSLPSSPSAQTGLTASP
jgi:hypothetical protein